MIREISFVVGYLDTNCYIVYDDVTKKAIIIDPGGDSDRILEWINRLGLKVIAILATHGHFDHVLAVDEIRNALGCEFYMNRSDEEIMHISFKWLEQLFNIKPPKPPSIDHDLAEETQLLLSKNYRLRILSTPGHSPGSVCIYIENAGILFTGDTLFAGTVGRTDLPGSSYRDLMKSIAKIYRLIPRNTYVYPGHGPRTSLEVEYRINPFVEEALKNV